MKPLLLAILGLTLLAPAASAQQVPIAPEVRAVMVPKALSLWTRTLPLGQNSEPLLLHLSVVPGRVKRTSTYPPVVLKDLASRQWIAANKPFEESPFFLDIFAKREGKYQKLNSVEWKHGYGLSSDSLQLRWLDRQTRTKPVLLLSNSVPRATFWWVLTFPEGIEGRARVQKFWAGSGGGSGTSYRFDQTDQSGLMAVTREDFSPRTKKKTMLRFDGESYAPRGRSAEQER